VRLVCEFCRNEVVVDRFAVKAADYRARLDEYLSESTDPSWVVEGSRFRVVSRLATGHSTDVFLAKRATRLSERVILKRLRAVEDEALLRNEQRVLAALALSRAQGAAYFTTLLPQRVAFGRLDAEATPVSAAVFREPVGFVHTLADVARVYSNALDPRHAVWIGRRVLELLSFVHRSGFVHRAVLPEHILVNVREHGARLVGFSCAAEPGKPAELIDPRFEALYPAGHSRAQAVEARHDLCMLANCLLWATRGHAEQPAPLERLLNELARGGSDDAWQAQEKLGQAARESFGAPRFVELRMP
jgi:hypothetical protein